jgi:tight adherence protein B
MKRKAKMRIFLVTLIATFLVSIFTIELLLYAYRRMNSASPTKLRKRVRAIPMGDHQSEAPDILRKKTFSSIPALNKILSRSPGVEALYRLVQQANVKYPLSIFALLALVLALAGYSFSYAMTRNPATSFLVGGLLGGAPFYYLVIKKRNRMQKFVRQLPEGLDLIARGLRAGHAFSTGLKLASDNFGDPLGTEFEETLDEINFGVSVPDALKNLAKRVDCPDLKFFVVSVILQRETGGNLAEIIDSISRIIRERFKFNDKVRVLSAEAKFSAKVLVGLPLLILVALRFINPEYVNLLFEDPMGKKMLAVAAFMMFLGIVVMMRMVKIRV